MPRKFSIHDVIQDLTGTTMTLQNVLDDYSKDESDLTPEDHATIDSEIFCCDNCGWWCEVSESNEDGPNQICDDCNDED
jgi:hypothetical protein